MGCERNADVVSMVSYAPLLGHVEGRTELTGAPPPWHAMIYYDGTRSFGTVSYYLWKLFRESPRSFCADGGEFPGCKPITVAARSVWAHGRTRRSSRTCASRKMARRSTRQDSSEAKGYWQRDSGRWSVTNGVYRGGRQGQGFSYFGDESWTDYTDLEGAQHGRRRRILDCVPGAKAASGSGGISGLG